jgi:arylsulfatase
MDFLPTFAAILGRKLPTDRPIDGVNQTAVLLGKSAQGARDTLLTFQGPDLLAVRWKAWRIYFKGMHRTGTTQTLGDLYIGYSGLYYPQVFNIEMDQHEDLNLGGINLWTLEFAFKPVKAYFESLKKYPNTPPLDLTNFSEGYGKPSG